MKNSKDCTKKLLELIHEFSKGTRYKMNIWKSIAFFFKSIAFLYASNKLSEREIKAKILFMIASKTIKYLGMNLTKDIKDLYSKNYDTEKEIEEDTNKWKHIPCL